MDAVVHQDHLERSSPRPSARIIAIDPGCDRSAWVELRSGAPQSFGIEPNGSVLERIDQSEADFLAIELVASYGMPVGREVFETCVWSGRFIQKWLSTTCYDESTIARVYRKDVKMYLCGNTRAKDGNIRQALIDRFGPSKGAAVGLKASPGPLYGVSKDVWAALAVAVTALDTYV